MAKKGKAKAKPKPARNYQQVIWEWVKTLVIVLVLSFTIKTSIVGAYSIPSGSMEDTLLIGDYFFANKFLYGARLPLIGFRLPAIRDPQQNDVIIFKKPNDPENYIKRCVAVGGQIVEIRNKILFVDGKRFPDPPYAIYVDSLRILPASQSPRDNFGPIRVPPGYYFMMGDNRDLSYDSRYWGPIARNMIEGKAVIILWSWGQDPHAPEWEWSDPISVGQALLYNTFHFVSRMRWHRSFTLIS
jgi:signal peptidase I